MPGTQLPSQVWMGGNVIFLNSSRFLAGLPLAEDRIAGENQTREKEHVYMGDSGEN